MFFFSLAVFRVSPPGQGKAYENDFIKNRYVQLSENIVGTRWSNSF